MKKRQSFERFFRIFPSAAAMITVAGLTSSLHAGSSKNSTLPDTPPAVVVPSITVDLVEVGDPGNQKDTTGKGAVADVFYIGKTDVTVSQYCAFLNAVAADDTFRLYDPKMGDNSEVPAMISREGTSPHFSYSVVGDKGDYPIIYVNYFSAQRFCNWLQNGQPTGSQVAGVTETGAYSLSPKNILVPSNVGATWRLPTEDEWYKTAYYKSGGTTAGYWKFPTQTDVAPGRDLAGYDDANYGVWESSKNGLSPVGAYFNSLGVFGTYDMGGDVNQWTSTQSAGYFSTKLVLRGGDWTYGSGWVDNNPAWKLASDYSYTETPDTKSDTIGFRVVGPASAAASSSDDNSSITEGDDTAQSIAETSSLGMSPKIASASLGANLSNGFSNLTPGEQMAIGIGAGIVIGASAVYWGPAALSAIAATDAYTTVTGYFASGAAEDSVVVTDESGNPTAQPSRWELISNWVKSCFARTPAQNPSSVIDNSNGGI